MYCGGEPKCINILVRGGKTTGEVKSSGPLVTLQLSGHLTKPSK